MELSTLLRTAIADSHRAIEATVLSRRMIQGTIDRSDYIELLGQLWLIHRELEERLAAVDSHGIYQADQARSATLQRDLTTLGSITVPTPLPETAELLELIGSAKPIELLGVWYVFEGSRMGSMHLSRTLAKALDVPPQMGVGLDYHVDGLQTRPQTWQQLRERLNALPLPATAQSAMAQAAQATMNSLLAIYEALNQPEAAIAGNGVNECNR